MKEFKEWCDLDGERLGFISHSLPECGLFSQPLSLVTPQTGMFRKGLGVVIFWFSPIVSPSLKFISGQAKNGLPLVLP